MQNEVDLLKTFCSFMFMFHVKFQIFENSVHSVVHYGENFEFFVFIIEFICQIILEF